MSAAQSILYITGGIVLNEVKCRNVENLCSGCPCLKASRLPPSVSFRFRPDKLHLRLIFNPLKNKRCASVLTFGKKGDSMSENEVFCYLCFFFLSFNVHPNVINIAVPCACIARHIMLLTAWQPIIVWIFLFKFLSALARDT